MNERIFKLALQAIDFHGAIDIDTELKLTNDQLEKFAEMIVRECLEQVRDEVQYEYDWKLADAVAKRVMDHFGVE